MNADKRRWVIIVIFVACFYTGSTASAFVDLETALAQEKKELDANYDRIIHWRFKYSEKHFGYGYPRVTSEKLEINGLVFTR